MTTRPQTIAAQVKREASQRSEGVRLSGASPIAAVRSPMAGTKQARATAIGAELERQGVTARATGGIEFTPRELEVLGALASGASMAQAAVLLHLSRHTIKNHAANCMRKCGVHSFVEAIHVAIREGALASA